jgi:hypothetical protein
MLTANALVLFSSSFANSLLLGIRLSIFYFSHFKL